jgi:hypothetical protein
MEMHGIRHYPVEASVFKEAIQGNTIGCWILFPCIAFNTGLKMCWNENRFGSLLSCVSPSISSPLFCV